MYYKYTALHSCILGLSGDIGNSIHMQMQAITKFLSPKVNNKLEKSQNQKLTCYCFEIGMELIPLNAECYLH